MKKLFTLAVGLIALTQSFAQVQRSQAVEVINNSYGNGGVPSTIPSYATPYEPGQNRYIGLIFMAEFNSAISYPTAITYNGVPMTRLSGSQDVLTDKAVVQIWAINEAQLALGNGGAGTPANVGYPFNITWSSKNSGSYYMAVNSFRYASQTTSLPAGTRVNQGNSVDSLMLPQTTVNAGDLIFHFSMFTRDQISDINTADSPNTRPVSTNGFMGSPIVNGLRPTPAAKQFLATVWNNEAPLNSPSFSYKPTFLRTSTQNPTKWIVSGVQVPYVQFTKPVAGQVWIDADGDGVKDGNETVPNPSEYRVIAVSKSGSASDIYNDKVRYIFTFDADGLWSGNVNAEFIREGPIDDPQNYVAPQYEFALVKTSTLGGSLQEGQAPPSGIGNNSMGTAPQSFTAYYVHEGTAGTLAIAENGISSALLKPTAPGFGTQNIKFGIQSRPNNIDASIGAGTLKGKQFISLAGSPLTATDSEDGLLQGQPAGAQQAGNKLIITKINETFPGINGKNFTIKLAYVPSNLTRQPLESDVITNLPFTINEYNPDNLYAYYIEGDGSLVGVELFEYTFVDAAGATGGLPPTPGNQIGNGGQILGSGLNGEGVFSFTGVLPVNSLELAGTYNSGKANLRWKLNGSDDVARYELERGNNASGFRTVATMSSNGREYNHVDDLSAFTGSDAFYRVKLVRTNGAVSYSNVISLKLATITGLQLMPTIVQSNLQVRFNNTRSQDVTIRVMNISGQAVMTQTSKLSAGNASISLNGFERLTNGTYSVQVFAGSTVTQGKIVVQH